MKKLSDILEGILDAGSIESDITKVIPNEIIEMINLWKKVKWRKSTGNFSQAYPDDVALGALYSSIDLLEKCDCKRISKSEMRDHQHNHDDVVIIKAGSMSATGIYVGYMKTEECLRIYEDSIVDDRTGSFAINPTVISSKVRRIALLNTFTKSSEQYIVLPGTCWNSLKNVLQA